MTATLRYQSPSSAQDTCSSFKSIRLIGVIAACRSFDMRLAAILGPACFLGGAAGVHINSMITEHNFARANAGIIFWSDILIPLIGFVFL
ncbi:MAG: DUF6790 family protein [Methyloceanibacter sp.]